VIEPIHDFSKEHDHDVALDLTQGPPRFYVMALDPTGLCFHAIARHIRTTQCLGSTQQLPWYMGVALPSDPLNPNGTPDEASLKVFHIPGHLGIKLHKATWHAGPLFSEPQRHLFYNLELIDTNVTDFNTYDWTDQHTFVFDPIDA